MTDAIRELIRTAERLANGIYWERITLHGTNAGEVNAAILSLRSALDAAKVELSRVDQPAHARGFYLCTDCSSPVACRNRRWCGSDHPDLGHPADTPAAIADPADDDKRLGWASQVENAATQFDMSPGQKHALMELALAIKEDRP